MYEVHDYIKSYLGESKDAHDFAKQFLERRQKLKPPSQQVRKMGLVGDEVRGWRGMVKRREGLALLWHAPSNFHLYSVRVVL